MAKILIIDDNPAVYTALEVLFSLEGISCVYAEDPATGLSILRENGAIDLVIQDMNFSGDTTSGDEGVALFHDLRQLCPHLPIILLTAWTHLEQAVNLMKVGAADYLGKPWDDRKLITTVNNLLQLGQLAQNQARQDNRRRQRQQELAERFDLCGLIYASEEMHELVATAVRVAKADVPVLITGPNGSGKEKIAELIQANSNRGQQPFVRVNMGALPADLLEAELFGVEAGAYTGAQKARAGRFEAADQGTLFLDEIGNLPLSGQIKLLRVVQTGEYQRLGANQSATADVRLISATNSDLRQAIEVGSFREDLYYRLNLIELAVPALAARPDDILPLASAFLDADYALDRTAEKALINHAWPGNVRELQNCIQRAMLLCAGRQISSHDLALPGMADKRRTSAADNPHQEPDEDAIRTALKAAAGIVSAAAKDLGLSRQALYRRMEKFGIRNDA